jgi:hypothetical protein
MEYLFAIIIIFIIFEIPTCIGMGLIFKKEHMDIKKGIIPFYNKIILIRKYNLPQYYIILIFIPIIGLYANYEIYKKMTEKYNKNIVYVLELTFLPFIYNIFLGLEIKQQEEIENYFEDQKEIYNLKDRNTSQEKPKDEYIWFPKQKIKSDTVYKASRNSLNAKVNVSIKNNEEIINNNKNKQTRETNKKICPNCGNKISANAEVCYICGNKM